MGTVARVKQHDYGRSLVVDLNYQTDTLNITDAIAEDTPVVFIMTPQDDPLPVIDRSPATVTDVDTVNRTVTVTYDWQSGDTATVGTYRGEFEFTLSGGAATAPTNGYILIIIEDDLG